MPTVADCVALVAAEYKLTRAEILGQQRARKYARPRQIAMWIASKATTASLPEIGLRIGKRHHTTIMWGIKVVDKLRAEDASFTAKVDDMLGRFAGERDGRDRSTTNSTDD